MQALVHAQLELVSLIARQLTKVLKGAVHFDDLLSAGHEGLLDAARRFEPHRGVPFRGYASIRIRGAMLDAVRRGAALPRRAFQRLSDLQAANDAAQGLLEQRTLHPDAEGAELALDQQVAALATACVASTLRAHAGATAHEQSRADHDTPEDQYARVELFQRLNEAVTALAPPLDRIVQLYYFEGRTLAAIGEELVLERSWVGRLHTHALSELTKRLRGSV